MQIENSGLEVWLYDDANLATLREASLLRPQGERGAGAFRKLAKQGKFVGYSLLQDDSLDLGVYVGAPLEPRELSVARWLEPQTALLRLPTGELRVESNDACRFGPDKPGAAGATLKVPPGDYRLTLYRVDHEALDREGLKWTGPQEVVVLTPGGKSADAADELLPFEPRRDKSWIGKYQIAGGRAEALAWFPDRADTFVVNLDAAALKRLALTPGRYLRTRVPAAGLELVSVFARTWDEARRLPLPAGLDPDEYGCAALTPMADWDQAEALFCRRDRARKRVEEKHQNLWLPAIVEVLDAEPAARPAGATLAPIDLGTKSGWFEPGFLSMVLSEVLPEVEEWDDLTLPDALKALEKRLQKLGLTARGDYGCEAALRGPAAGLVEVACRLYTGLPNGFFAVLVTKGTLELLFVSELAAGAWIATGLADDLERLIRNAGRPGIQLQAVDDRLAKIHAAHKASVSKQPLAPAPTSAGDVQDSFTRFLRAAFG